MEPYGRIGRSVATGGAAVAVLSWIIYAIDPDAWPGMPLPLALTGIAVANVPLTLMRPAAKVACVRVLQRWLLNPLVHGLVRIGINPLGVTMLETTGRRSGLPRVTPVGTARDGDRVWIIAEHGRRAGYIRNIDTNPRVRLRLRSGVGRAWRTGVAYLEHDDDPLARQRWMAGWNPIRWLNVAMVRFLGTELLSVRIELDVAQHRSSNVPTSSRSAQTPPSHSAATSIG